MHTMHSRSMLMPTKKSEEKTLTTSPSPERSSGRLLKRKYSHKPYARPLKKNFNENGVKFPFRLRRRRLQSVESKDRRLRESGKLEDRDVNKDTSCVTIPLSPPSPEKPIAQRITKAGERYCPPQTVPCGWHPEKQGKKKEGCNQLISPHDLHYSTRSSVNHIHRHLQQGENRFIPNEPWKCRFSNPNKNICEEIVFGNWDAAMGHVRSHFE